MGLCCVDALIVQEHTEMLVVGDIKVWKIDEFTDFVSKVCNLYKKIHEIFQIFFKFH